MLQDRSYMRSDYPRRTTSALVWLIAALVAAYVIELVFLSPWLGATSSALVNQLTLTVRSFQSGHVWTLLTHSLLHSTQNPIQILCIILGLIFIGREVEPLVGSKRFLVIYGSAVVLGALCWTAIHWSTGGVYLGASAGVFGLFVALLCFYSDQEIDFPVFFLLPVTIRPKYVAVGIVALNLLGLALYELRGLTPPFDYAPSAQLGGMLAGWIYFKYFHANNGWDRAPTVELPSWLRPNKRTNRDVPSVSHKVRPPSTNLRAEVDAILDKINSQGFRALTEDEKRILDEAKDLLSRH